MEDMAARRILQLGDPALRLVSVPVVDLSSASAVIQDLEDTLAAFRRTHGFGRAISAIQIGSAVRVIFCLVDGVRHELINPEWTLRGEEKFWLWDDCFSFPNLMVWLDRSRYVRLRHQNRAGEWLEIEASDGMAELIQHEMDHLDGVLAVNRARGAHALSTRDEWIRRHGAPPDYSSSSTLFSDVP